MALPGLAVCIAVTACNGIAPCGRTRSISTQGSLQITPVSGFDPAAEPGVPSALEFDADPLFDSNLGERTGAFEDLWRILIEGRSLPTGQGVAFTLQGRTPERLESLTRLVLILPAPLRDRARVPIGDAFPVPIGSNNPDVFGTRYLGREPLLRNDTAAIAVFYGRREFTAGNPIAEEVPEFIAAAASGTVQIDRAGGRELRMSLDVQLTDAAGRRLRLLGELLTIGNVTNDPCIS